ncbi:hypothetical protein [Enterococcus sp. AZ102]|uniref:hypothetical protein n=1 Tax=Enterococcus sp. AZ102 TaxID=2774865 RepID=UPI003F1F55A6
MKTSKLIKELESLKYVNRVITEKGMILVHGTYRLIATVREHKSFEMAMVLTDLDINDEQRKELFELISEYAATPIEQRKDKTIEEKAHEYIQECVNEDYDFYSCVDNLIYNCNEDIESEIYLYYVKNSNEFIKMWMEVSKND